MVYIDVCIFIVPSSDLEIQGSSSTLGELDKVTIECSVTANPPANVIWLKRTTGGIKKLINTSRTSITCNLVFTLRGPVTVSTLVIGNVEAADSGDYVCEARNSHSSPIVSTNFSVSIIGKSNLYAHEICVVTVVYVAATTVNSEHYNFCSSK